MKRNYFLLLSVIILCFSVFTGCSKDDDKSSDTTTTPTTTTPKDTTTTPTETIVSGDVSGVWEKNSIVHVTGHINVPADKSLTIEEGVQVIVSDNGVGASHVAIEFIVNGNLYCKGTETNPVLFSVDESKRTATNRYTGLWGGIIGGSSCGEMLFDHVIMEYTGGDCTAESPSVLAGYYTAGADWDPCITTNNPKGTYVVVNSTFRYASSDALYFMGGKAIIQNNTFYSIGETQGEAINMKAGCQVDAAYNLIFSPNTNGLKLSSAGQDDASGRSQALVRAYNNTIINAGWRRDGTKGGSIYAEKGVLLSVFNNLIVNSKFMAKTPKWNQPGPTNGADNASVIDYNFYASGSSQSPFSQDNPKYMTSYMGYTAAETDYWHDGSSGTPKVDEHSIVSSSAGDAATDPKFAAFDINAVGLSTDDLNSAWNFHVQAGSPVLSNAYSDFTGVYAPYFGTTGLTVGGTTYKTTVPSARFGAFGQ